jgi:SAM-dependent methyltransferase
LTFAFELTRGPVKGCRACGVQIAQDEGASPDQDTQFHAGVDEARYVDYFEPFRKSQYRHVLSRLPIKRGDLLLDIGASYGWLVEVGIELGLDAYGLEPSPMDYDPLLADRIVCRTLHEHASCADRPYDLVTLWHVLEHLRDPFEAAREIAGLLASDGLVVIAVPNAEGSMYRVGARLTKSLGYGRLMEELWYTHNPNMHRYYPTLESVRQLLAQAKLCIVESYTLDAFDWRRIWRRSTSPVGRAVLRAAGPVLHRSRFTRRENLIVVAQPRAR